MLESSIIILIIIMYSLYELSLGKSQDLNHCWGISLFSSTWLPCLGCNREDRDGNKVVYRGTPMEGNFISI